MAAGDTTVGSRPNSVVTPVSTAPASSILHMKRGAERGRASSRLRQAAAPCNDFRESAPTMLDHIILTVSDVERSLAFYEAALKPLNIKFFMPYKGEA